MLPSPREGGKEGGREGGRKARNREGLEKSRRKRIKEEGQEGRREGGKDRYQQSPHEELENLLGFRSGGA